MIVCGVDPGVSGALALVDLSTSRLLTALDMPMLRFDTRTRLAVDARAIGDWLGLAEMAPELVVIEHQQPMPGDGKTNAYVLGATLGGVATAMAALGLPMHFVVPPSWKRRCGLLGKPKEQALTAARQLFGVCPEFGHGRGIGDKVNAIARAEATLIAWHGLPEQMRGERTVAVRAPKPAAVARRRVRRTEAAVGSRGDLFGDAA